LNSLTQRPRVASRRTEIARREDQESYRAEKLICLLDWRPLKATIRHGAL
jgi:hypothetical protein